MNIVGRIAEKLQLQDIVSNKEPAFVALYGRRRVGKTYLVKQFFNEQFTFYTTGLAQATGVQQRYHFVQEMNQQLHVQYSTPATWLEIFKLFIKELKKIKGKRIIFIDELPWLDTKKSDFMTGLEYFWNAWASTQVNLVLIVCGSAASWMVDNLIKNRGGLHNRVTCRMYLAPFTLAEAEAYTKARQLILDRHQIVQLYMAFGGVPYYWSCIKKGQSATQIINELCFKKDAVLQTEFTFIFESLFSNSSVFKNIIQSLFLLGGKATREALLLKLGQSTGGSITKKLEALEMSGFINSQKTFGLKGGKTIYILTDFYTLFYYKFIQAASKKSVANYWKNLQATPAMYAWQGLAFEQVCFAHQAQILNTLQIGGISTAISSWQVKATKAQAGSQVDMVIDRKDRIINLCEIKFTENEFVITKVYNTILRHKLSRFKEAFATNKSIHLVIVSMHGLKQNEYSGSIVQQVITGNDLFA